VPGVNRMKYMVLFSMFKRLPELPVPMPYKKNSGFVPAKFKKKSLMV
jgi:hypothetical protein